MARVMVCGPFSALMRSRRPGGYEFSGPDKERIDAVHRLLEGAGHQLLSAHRADFYGERPWVENFVQRDLDWAASCDVQVVLLPAGPAGDAVRSDGTMIEVGFAAAMGKPVVLLADEIDHAANSFFLRSFAERNAQACVDWRGDFEEELLRGLAELAVPASSEGRPREHRTDVDGVIDDLRAERQPHKVVVGNMSLTVLPGVLSPRLSHAPDALIAKWRIPPGADVLDLGCGSGVLGLAALREGAGHLVSLDINPQAVRTAALNLVDLGLSERGEARQSDVFSALKSTERFDVILFAAPYWDRPATDDLERSCFDEDYGFFSRAIYEAAKWLKPAGAMYVIFSDQGDVGRGLRIIDGSGLCVQEMHLDRPTQANGHIRIIWELRLRKPA